jgi:oligopeptidase B
MWLTKEGHMKRIKQANMSFKVKRPVTFVAAAAVVAALLMVLGAGMWWGCPGGNKPAETSASPLPVPPKAEKIRKELTFHQHTRVDYFYWLNQRDNPRVIEYLKAENEYLEKTMKHTKTLQKKLFDEITGRIKLDDSTVPYKTNGYYYYDRYKEGAEYPIYCRRKGSMESKEEMMLDINEMAKGYDFYWLAAYRVSPDNTMIAYGVDTLGMRKYTIYFKNLVTGTILPEQIPNTSGIAEWANDNKTVFYTAKDNALRPCKIFKHLIGTPVSRDKEVYHEADEAFTVNVSKSKSKKYLFIVSYHLLSREEYRFLDADHPNDEFKIFEPRQKNHIYYVEHYNDKFYIRTDWNAKNYRLMETLVSKTGNENWQEIIPHRDDVVLEEMEIFKNFLVVMERKRGLPHLRVVRWDDKQEYDIDFGEETYRLEIAENPEIDTDILRYYYSSLTTPTSVFDYDMNNKTGKLLKQEGVLGDFNPQNYKAEHLFAPAADGTLVPISLVYKKGLVKNGANPLLLYGYGAYGLILGPYFSSPRLSLLDRGFVYAEAYVRGGGEMGRYWHEEGKLLKKKNTFTDFIACAEYLVAEKYTNPGKLFANGGSAGGLLMGAVANMRPDLFKGIIAEVPFVDVLTTKLDKSIHLATETYDEWGNPQEKVHYDNILSYSPYENVKAQDYPAMLVITGLHDSQVQYWGPAKWVAKLRDLKTDHNLLLLSTDMEAGHGGSSGRFQSIKEGALVLAFILDQLGITK